MEEPASLLDSGFRGSEPCSLHRIRILKALHGICLQIGKLQKTENGRLACEEVARMLEEARAREMAAKNEGRA